MTSTDCAPRKELTERTAVMQESSWKGGREEEADCILVLFRSVPLVSDQDLLYHHESISLPLHGEEFSKTIKKNIEKSTQPQESTAQ